MTEYYERFQENLSRVKVLCDAYEKSKQGSSRGFTDILRAAAVFLHAAQEDYYRSVLTKLLPVRGTEKALNKIALMETEGRAEKFYLSALVKYSEMTAHEIIRQSVQQHMRRTTFNKYSEIVSWMSCIGVSINQFDKQQQVDKLIQRRHKIVHEVDLANSEKRKTSSIDIKTVNRWKDAVSQLVKIIDGQIDNNSYEEKKQVITSSL